MAFWKAFRHARILAFVPVIACGKDLRDTIQEHKAKVESKLAQLGAIRTAAMQAPLVTVDAVDINGPPPRIAVREADTQANVAVEYLEDLEDLQSYGNVPHRIDGTGSVNRCAALFATRRKPYDPRNPKTPAAVRWDVADDEIAQCEATRYVFVVRSLAFAEPSSVRTSSGSCPTPSSSTADAGIDASAADGGVDAGAADAGAKTTISTEKCHRFDGGYLRADVLVYDLLSTKYLGGFRFTAESSPRIDVSKYSIKANALGPDFERAIRTTFHAAAQKHVPALTVGN